MNGFIYAAFVLPSLAVTAIAGYVNDAQAAEIKINDSFIVSPSPSPFLSWVFFFWPHLRLAFIRPIFRDYVQRQHKIPLTSTLLLVSCDILLILSYLLSSSFPLPSIHPSLSYAIACLQLVHTSILHYPRPYTFLYICNLDIPFYFPFLLSRVNSFYSILNVNCILSIIHADSEMLLQNCEQYELCPEFRRDWVYVTRASRFKS